MSVREKFEMPTVHDRDTDGSGMHYLCFRRSRKFAETGRSRYIFGTIDDARMIHSTLAFFRALSLPRLRTTLLRSLAVPQVVGLVRVIQGISAETDVGVDRRVSFSHPSRGPTICHNSAPSFSLSIPDVSQNVAERYDRA